MTPNQMDPQPTLLSQQELAEIRRDFQDCTVHRLLDHIEAQRIELEALRVERDALAVELTEWKQGAEDQETASREANQKFVSRHTENLQRIADLEQQLADAKIEAIPFDILWRTKDEYQIRTERAESALEAARKAIEEWECDDSCSYWDYDSWRYDPENPGHPIKPCTCWKSRALAALPVPPTQAEQPKGTE